MRLRKNVDCIQTKERGEIEKTMVFFEKRVRDKDFNWTSDASKISDKIGELLRPLFLECIKDGWSVEEFMYLVFEGTNEMTLLELLNDNKLLKLRNGEIEIFDMEY